MFKYLDNMDCLALLSSILLAVFMLLSLRNRGKQYFFILAAVENVLAKLSSRFISIKKNPWFCTKDFFVLLFIFYIYYNNF